MGILKKQKFNEINVVKKIYALKCPKILILFEMCLYNHFQSFPSQVHRQLACEYEEILLTNKKTQSLKPFLGRPCPPPSLPRWLRLRTRERYRTTSSLKIFIRIYNTCFVFTHSDLCKVDLLTCQKNIMSEGG